jgi:hypothetical protein
VSAAALAEISFFPPAVTPLQESPDYWLTLGNPWEIKRNKVKYTIPFGGTVTKAGKWTPEESVRSHHPLSPSSADTQQWDKNQYGCEDIAAAAILSRRRV